MTDEEPSGNSRPLVTIGIPVFNGAAYLEDAIRSAMNQTFTDLEIVVSDNASTDSTPAILERLAGEALLELRLLRARQLDHDRRLGHHQPLV